MVFSSIPKHVPIAALLIVASIIAVNAALDRPGEISQIQESSTPQFSSVPATTERQEISGVLAHTDLEKGILSFRTQSGEMKHAVIWPETRIVKSIAHDPNGILKSVQEFNMSDIAPGTEIRVRYGADGNGDLTHVDEIYAGEISAVDFETALKPRQFFGYEILSFDQQAAVISYRVMSFVTKEESDAVISVAPPLPLYVVDSFERVGILHARIPAPVGAIQPGDSVFPVLKASNGERSTLEAVVIVKES